MLYFSICKTVVDFGQQPLNPLMLHMPTLIPVNMNVSGLREDQVRAKDDVTHIHKQNPLTVFPGTGYPADKWSFLICWSLRTL